MRTWKSAFLCSLFALAVLVQPFAGGRREMDSSAAHLKYYCFASAGVELEIVTKFVNWFQNKYPGITVEFARPQGSFHQAIFRDFAAGLAPDIYNQGGIELEQYVDLGITANLTPYMTNDKDYKESDLLKVPLDYFRLNRDPKEDIYALSTGWSPQLLFYNKTMFEKAGLKSPDVLYKEGKWNRDTFLAAVRALAKDTNGDGANDQWGWEMPSWHSNMFDWLAVNGVDSVYVGDTLRFDDPAVREIYQLVHDLMYKERVVPRPGEINAADGFTIGKVAMMVTTSFTVGRLKALNPDWEYGVTMLPKLKRDHTYLYSNGIAMTTATKHPDQAWLFVREFACNEGARLTAEYEYAFPLAKRFYEAMNVEPIWENSLKGATPVDRHRKMSTVRVIIQKHHAAYMEDPNGDLEKMIRDITKDGNEALQE